MSDNAYSDRQSWVADALARHEAGLLRYAARLSGDENTARDAVQETFLNMCAEDPAKLDGRLTPWLYTVCRNRVLDHKRKSKRERTATDTADRVGTTGPGALPDRSTDAPCPDPDPSRAASDKEGLSNVLSLLDALPANQQSVIRLRFQSSLSYKEIAEITELSVTNVGFLIHKAIKTIRDRMTATDQRAASTEPLP